MRKATELDDTSKAARISATSLTSSRLNPATRTPRRGSLTTNHLRFETPERFAHRHMAYTELLGNMILPEPRTRLKRAGDDAIGQYAC